MAPPLVLGPVVHHLTSLDTLNTSNEVVRDLTAGKYKNEEIPSTGRLFYWVDVRDLALGHVRAMELDAAVGMRFLIGGGYLSNKEIVNILRKHFPEIADRLPGENAGGGDYLKDGLAMYDNTPNEKILGIKFRTPEECPKSLQAVGAK